MDKRIILIFLLIMGIGFVQFYACTDDDDSDPVNTPTPTPPPEAETFMKTYGGDALDRGYFAIQTADGGYLISGDTDSYGTGMTDIWVIKSDSHGEVEWSNTYGGAYEEYGAATTLAQGGYVIGGGTTSYGAGSYDYIIYVLDEQGNEQWMERYGSTASERYNDGAQTSDNGYVLCGSCNGDVWIIKTDAMGNEEWNVSLGGSEIDNGESIRETSDGGYIVASSTRSYGAGNFDAWLIKINSQGVEEWSATYGGQATDVIRRVEVLDDGFIGTGYTENNTAGKRDLWILRTDSSGTVLWERTIGGSEGDSGRSIIQTADGGFVVSGVTRSFGQGDSDVYLIKLDSNGNTLWEKTHGTAYFEDSYSVRGTDDGGFILCGAQSDDPENAYSSWDFLVIKTDENGDV